MNNRHKGDRHDILQGSGDRHDVGPVRRRPLIAVTETAAVILATLTYRGRNTLAPRLIGDSTDGGGVEP
jgi:hypothetical protein